jgi:Actin-fragmin kinase, catalytic
VQSCKVEVKFLALNADKESSSKEDKGELDIINPLKQEVNDSTCDVIDLNQLVSIEMPQQGRRGAVFILTDSNKRKLVVKFQENRPYGAAIGTKILQQVGANPPKLSIATSEQLTDIKRGLKNIISLRYKENVKKYLFEQKHKPHAILQDLAPGKSIGKTIDSEPIELLNALLEKQFQNDLGRIMAADQFVGNSDRLQGETNMKKDKQWGFFNAGNLFIDRTEQGFRAIGIDNDFKPTIWKKGGYPLGTYLVYRRTASMAVSNEKTFSQEVNLIVDRIIQEVHIKHPATSLELASKIEEVNKSRNEILQGITMGAKAALDILLPKRKQPKGEGWKRRIVQEGGGSKQEYEMWKKRKKEMQKLQQQ